MKIAIVGYGIEGQSSYEYFVAHGHEITICDQSTDISVPDGAATRLGEQYLDNLDQYDMVVRTAGMPPKVILDANPGVAEKITTQLNEFLRACPTKNVIGITGTKGKGTTSTLVTKMLEAALRPSSGSSTVQLRSPSTAGKQVFLGGNIGMALFSFIDQIQPDSWVILELSSFQLMDLKFSPHIAVCLMVVPEHLNWHADMDEYIASKSHLFAQQTPDDIAIYFAENDTSKQIASAGSGQKIPYFSEPGATVQNKSIVIDGQEICKTTELKLLGKHNWQNVCAAVTAAWQVTQDVEAVRSVLTTFSGLAYRLEFVRELNGVKYYNDSFGTTPETAIVALQAFTQPKVVILGGSDKGATYDELAAAVKANSVRKALLIGEQAANIQTALETVGFTDFAAGGTTMDEIVKNARNAAQSGDVVLLSTACASFDMFENYKDRGNQFTTAVQALA